MVTAGLALTLCLTWAVMPHNEVWNGVLFIYTRANANAVLVALNSRNSARDQGRSNVYTASGSNSMGMGTISYTRGGGTEVQSPTVAKDGIFIQTQTETVNDKEYPL
jgi:hypothetical protein